MLEKLEDCMTWKGVFSIVCSVALAVFFSAGASASILTPGTGGQLPDIFAGCSGCTLLASNDSGLMTSSFNGVVLAFDLVSAVYSDPSNTFGAGDLDFMYQVTNESSSTDSIGRVTAISFAGFQTDVGYTAAGSTLPGGLFVDGSVAPGLVDRNTASTVGFGFAVAPSFQLVPPGEASTVLIIQTNATRFTSGQVSVIDGKATTVDSFGPASVPEPRSLLFLVGSMLTLGFIRVRRFRA
jgi:hypothetical protein